MLLIHKYASISFRADYFYYNWKPIKSEWNFNIILMTRTNSGFRIIKL